MRDIQGFIWGKQDKSNQEDKVGLVVRMMNVGTGERIFRFVIGAVLIALAFFISGTSGWILGFIGVAVIPTAIFGY